MDDTQSTLETIDRFNDAFNRFDIDAVMAVMTEDIVFENTAGPEGERFEGQASVRAYFTKAFQTTASGRFDPDEIFAAGDRGVVRWDFVFDRRDPARGHVRGVDIFRVRDGKVSEKLSYIRAARLDEIVKRSSAH